MYSYIIKNIVAVFIALPAYIEYENHLLREYVRKYGMKQREKMEMRPY